MPEVLPNAAANAAQVQLVPLGELAPGQAAAIRNRVVEGLIALASKENKLPPNMLVSRDLTMDTDLDGTTEDFGEKTGATIGAYETLSTGTMADQRYVGIFGIKDNSENPTVSAIKISVGNQEKVIWQLQGLNEHDGKVGLCPSAVVITPNAPYTISRWVLVANAGTTLVLKGVVVEPRGKLISP